MMAPASDTTGLIETYGTTDYFDNDGACKAPDAEPMKEEPDEGWRAYERAQFRYAEGRYQARHRGDIDRNKAPRAQARRDRPRNKLRKYQTRDA